MTTERRVCLAAHLERPSEGRRVQHDQSLIAMHVSVFGSVLEADVGRNRQLKQTAAARMNAVAVSLVVLADSRLPAGEDIEKTL